MNILLLFLSLGLAGASPSVSASSVAVCLNETPGTALPSLVGTTSHKEFWDLMSTAIDWATGAAPGSGDCTPSLARIDVSEQYLTSIQGGGHTVTVNVSILPTDPTQKKASFHEESPVGERGAASAYRESSVRATLDIANWLTTHPASH